MSSGYHTTWNVPPEHREAPAYRAAGRRTDFAQAVYDRRSALGWNVAELARRAELSEEDVEAIEESSVDPIFDLIECLVTAMDADARIAPRTSPEFRFEDHAA
ncbi:helix-turn-helix domain-containing protein [Streptomyces sp. NEAU-W12]|uniref:helix-turn-helix domain-containing protein n=1 Tax=Streptomyces sp. NEAU-W12 TaxID=2994668 RepID=UPI00224B0B4B|nr:hypothetical protein [Streptomyces sp. NEAU-W12]MCX2927358.1 hypothetical protein [Streptomyces sp. NEAU-W12]